MAPHEITDPDITVLEKQSIHTLDYMMRARFLVLQKSTRGVDRSVDDVPRVGCQTNPFIDVIR